LYLTNLSEWFAETFSGSRKGIKDTIVSFIPQAVTLLTGIITSVLIARGLGPTGMGQYALILSFSGLAAILSDLGIGSTAIRFASRSASSGDTVGQYAILRWAFRIRMFLVCITTCVIFLIIPFIAEKVWNVGNLTFLMRLSLLIGIFGAISSIPIIYFQSLKRFKMNTTVLVGQTLFFFIGILIIAIVNRWSLRVIIIVSVLTSGITSLIFLFLVPKTAIFNKDEFLTILKSKFRSTFQLSIKYSDKIGKADDIGINAFAFYLVLSAIVLQVTLRADIWLMGVYLDKSQIGVYNVATKFTMPLAMVLGAINTALWPRASSLVSDRKIKELLHKTFRLSVLVAFCSLFYSIFAPLLTPYIFGSKYEAGIHLGQILCLRYFIAIMICPLSIIGYNFGLVGVYSLINFIQMIIVICINLLLLPKMGAMGSALALIAYELFGGILIALIIRRKMIKIT